MVHVLAACAVHRSPNIKSSTCTTPSLIRFDTLLQKKRSASLLYEVLKIVEPSILGKHFPKTFLSLVLEEQIVCHVRARWNICTKLLKFLQHCITKSFDFKASKTILVIKLHHHRSKWYFDATGRHC